MTESKAVAAVGALLWLVVESEEMTVTGTVLRLLAGSGGKVDV